MSKFNVRKVLVCGIILLFVGAGVIPSTISIIEEKTAFTGINPRGYIQDLIDNASNGDTIYIPSGTYYENIVINKSINLVGEDKNTTIIDGSVSGDVIHVDADGVNISGFTIQNGGIRGRSAWDAGIDVRSDFNIINGNIIGSNNGCGVYLYLCSNNIITGNTIISNHEGLFIDEHTNNNTISNNIIISNEYIGIYLQGNTNNNNIISGNNISFNNEEGVVMSSLCNSNTVSGNTISSNGARGLSLVYSSNSNTITDNTFFNNGLFVLITYQNTVSSNTVNGKPLVYLEEVSDTYIENNAGQVILIACDNITVQNQELSNTSVGIQLSNTGNCLISDNIISNNFYGIHLFQSSNNVIYNNYFDNQKNAFANEENIWNITKTPGENIIGGVYLGGNHWSDYRGRDLDGDGIGDTKLPYNSSGDIEIGGDWLPLRRPAQPIIYVDDDYNESTPGWGYDHFDNIQEGIDFIILPNGTIYVYNGTYYENVVVDIPVVLIGENRNTTIIDGGENGDVVAIQSDWVNISGFTIQNGAGTWKFGGIHLYSSSNIIISGNNVSNNYNGILIQGACNNINISDNIIDGNSHMGIYSFVSYNPPWLGSINNGIISGNSISGSQFGIFINLYNSIIVGNVITCPDIPENAHHICINLQIADNVIIKSNTLTNNGNTSRGMMQREGSAGIYMNNYPENCNISWNTITGNDLYGIYLDWPTNTTIYMNNITGNTVGIEIWNPDPNVSRCNMVNNIPTVVKHNNFKRNWLHMIGRFKNTYRPTQFEQNFWGRPRILPKFIVVLKMITDEIGIPSKLQLDWRPALKPYDIPRVAI